MEIIHRYRRMRAQPCRPGRRALLRRWFAVALLIFTVGAWAQGENFHFTRINGETAGLAQNGVHILFQDRQGYIWIGTEGGLNRFDGYSLERHVHDPGRADSLPPGLITAATDDDGGYLWIGLQGGSLVRYDPRTRSVVERATGPTDSLVSALFHDAAGHLWVGDRGAIGILPAKSGEVRIVHEVVNVRSDFLPPAVARFSQCPDGTLYAATSDGLLVLGESSATMLGTAEPVNDLTCDSRGRLYATTAGGVVHLSRESGERTLIWEMPAASTATANRLAIAPDGFLWVGLRGLGLLRVGQDGRQPQLIVADQAEPGSLPQADITRVFIDRSGLVWIGTSERGVAHTPSSGNPVELLRIDQTHDNNSVRAIFQDGQGRYWLGLLDTGLREYRPDTGEFIDHNRALRQASGVARGEPLTVRAIAAAAAGSLWLATDRGTYLFDPARDEARPLDLGPPRGSLDRYYDLLPDPDGSLWIAGIDSGLVHYRPGTGVLGRYTEADGLSDDYVLALGRDFAGRLWVGTLRGASYYDPITGRFQRVDVDPTRADALAGSRISDLRVDTQGNFWIATDAGINEVVRVEGDRLHVRRFLLRDGLADTMAYCALDDGLGNLWVSSNVGLSRVNRATGTVRILTVADGLQGLEFNAHACLRDAGGDLWFGGIKGLNRINPRHLGTSEFAPSTVLTEVQIGGQHVLPDAGTPLRMSQQAHVIRFAFAALDFTNPVANRFRYRMVGIDPDWVDGGRDNKVTYTNLRPGSYRFEVSGSNHAGIFNPVPASLDIIVTPPWWGSTAARAVGIALLACIGFLMLAGMRRRRKQRSRHQRQLERYRRRLRLALWGSGDHLWDLDIPSMTLRRTIVGDPERGDLEVNLTVSDLFSHAIHSEDLPEFEDRAMRHIEGETDRFEFEYRMRDQSGPWRWVRSSGQVVERDEDGRAIRMAGTTHSLEQQRAEAKQRRIAALVLQSMAEAVAVTDHEFRIISVNPAFTRIVGYTQEEAHGKSTRILDCDRHSNALYEQVRQTVRLRGRWRGEMWQRRKDGGEFLSWAEIHAIQGARGENTLNVVVMSDITERKRNEQELRYLANYDALSGLPNRTLLQARLAQAINMAARVQHKVAVLFIDLDRFKQVNDSMGHTIGDRMLEAAGARLRAYVRATDMVARLGGDEFSVVLENIAGIQQAIEAAETLIRAFDKPLQLATGQELVTSPSIGIALYPDHGDNPVELLKYADTAMYQAKADGRNTWALYTAELEARAREQASMLAALRQALANRELSVVYQPKLELGTWNITGVEALLRWHNLNLGEVPPSVFIPMAEESGLIADFSEFVFAEAFAVLARWQQHDVSWVTMAINISSAQLLSSRLERYLIQLIGEHEINPNRLVLELTESVIMTRTETSLRNLHALKALGLTLAIDDFGTGYSSLAYLKRLPVDVLKIDKEFVGDITIDPDDEAITETIINIGHSLGLEIIAEGVETFAQIVYLESRGCDEIQGNWLAKPLTAYDCLILICRHDPADKPAFPVSS